MTLPFDSYLDALEAAPANAPVPSCPGWTAVDLGEHLRRVYDAWRANLAGGGVQAPAPADGCDAGGPATATPLDAVTEAMHEAGSALLGELAAAGAEAPCWNWSGRDETGAWLARRIALETAVHRVDAEQCRGAARPVEAELAADGIEERIDVHLRCDVPDAPGASLGGSLCLVCSDADAAFVVEVGGGRLRWRHGRGPADAALVGTASELFLFTWNRQPLETLALTGRRDVAEAWAALPA